MRYPCYNRKKQLFGAGAYKESAVSAVLYGLAAGGIYLKQSKLETLLCYGDFGRDKYCDLYSRDCGI